MKKDTSTKSDPGDEALSENSDNITIPESMQSATQDFLNTHVKTEDHADHVSSMVHKHRAKMSSKSGMKGGKPSKFSTEDMPKS